MPSAEKIDGLPRDSPESRGIDPQAIIDFLEDGKASGVDFNGFMVYSKGAVIAEGWWDPYRPDLRHMMHSGTKGFLSVAVGMAVQEGYFALEDKVLSFFPEYVQTVVETNSTTELADQLTVEDLLTQTSGHDQGSSGASWRGITTSWIEQSFKIPFAHKPGTFFRYSSATSYLLSAIIHRTTGQSTKSFLMPRLFQPLGMIGVTWDVGPEEINPGGNGISCKTSDLLKLALLHLQGGVWEGQRLLSEEWVAKATQPQRGNEYGYQWWVSKDNDSYYAYGMFGQFAYVFPKHGAILVMTSSSPPGEEVARSLVRRHFPAILEPKGDPSIFSEDSFKKYLEALKIEAPQGPELSEKADEISDRLFVARPNADGVEAFALHSEHEKYVFHLWDNRGLHRVDAGVNRWVESETSVSLASLHHSYDAPQLLVSACGSWSKPETFEMKLQFIETAYQDQIVVRIVGDRIAVLERGVNVNSSGTQRPPIAAYMLDKGSGVSAGFRIADRARAARMSTEFNQLKTMQVFPYSTTSTSLNDLLDNEETKAAVVEEFAYLISHPMLSKGRRYTLRMLAAFVPNLKPEALERLDGKLGKIPYSWD
ncbi:uncharacterized protein A1O9_07985 [Exophiala aquamarina CBS 119918]|uniref:Beta-lactamase-related domain-containing protein n=1 Tax=Exophiala aquamarina CBS 119918 TaxID=1182545 RepID=A0A072P8I3_9EURO|nr:uncharacterized protein A1O9_07985 [Exophiala aquamarina CBS 119918]KEF56404.1 hypothetical protein A1O9_07985 [Exophiala aquamarina CBS 119918]